MRRPESKTAANTPEWLTAEELAEYLSLPSRKAVYQAVRRGDLPAYRLGKRVRFRRDEIDALMTRGRMLTPDDVSLPL